MAVARCAHAHPARATIRAEGRRDVARSADVRRVLPAPDTPTAIRAALDRVGLSRADLYDAFLGRPDEVDAVVGFLARAAPAARDVLDVGCGTGRLLPALAARFGGRVEGLEPDADYAAAARARGATVRGLGLQDLDDWSIWDLLVLANGPLVYMTDAAERARALRRAWGALRPGGALVVDAPNFLRFLRFYQAPAPETATVRGVSCVRTPGHAWDFHDALWVHQDELTLSAPDGTAASYQERFTFAILPAPTLRAEVGAAGFVDLQTFPGWHAVAPGRHEGTRLLLVARRPR